MEMKLLAFSSYEFTNWLPILSFMLLIFIFWKKTKATEFNSKLPPGPPSLPIIGNLHQIGGANPRNALRNLAAKYGPLMYIKLGSVSTVVVTSAKMAKEVLMVKDPAFANRPDGLATRIMLYDHEDLLFNSIGDLWKQLRKIAVMEILNDKRVRSFSFIRKDEISQMNMAIRSSLGDAVDLATLTEKYSSYMICRAAFGGVCKDREKILEHMKVASGFAGGFSLADLFPSLKIIPIMTGAKRKLEKMHREIDEVLEDVVQQHISNHAIGEKRNAEYGDEDVIDVLLRVMETQSLPVPLTSKHIKSLIFDMFIAGNDTASTTIEWAMSELMRNPYKLAKAQEEVRRVCNGKNMVEEADIQKLTYLKNIVNETLRMHPPIAVIPRATRGNQEVDGYSIPDKTHIMINTWAIGRDPQYWLHPDDFEPERFENISIDHTGSYFEFLPFGSGRRVCPGVKFGLVNIELPLANLLCQFNWRLAGKMNPMDLDMEEAPGIISRRKNNLYLIPTAYIPPALEKI